MMYAPFPTLTAADQAGQFVAERIAAGSDYLKIISGTGGLWPWLDPGTIQALVMAAHARGLLVVAHVSSAAGAGEVVSAGVDVVAHVPADAGLDKALAGRMAEAGIVVGPTLATIENTLGEPGGAAVAGDPRLAEALGDAWARRRRRLPRDGRPANAALLPGRGQRAATGRCGGHCAGGHGCSEPGDRVRSKPAPGAGTPGPVRHQPGAGPGRCHRRAGTSVRPRRPGTCRRRAARDLVLVSGDPLADITATRAIERIWRGGIACDRHAFAASAAEAEQLDAFDAQLAKVVAARARTPARLIRGGPPGTRVP